MTREVSSAILIVSSLLTAELAGGQAPEAANPRAIQLAPRAPHTWFKGNLHTHTLRSDGDSTPGRVVSWYRNHGYDFVAMTDHDRLAPVSWLNAQYGADGGFLVLQGEEVTDDVAGRPVHLNAIGPAEVVMPQHGDTIVDAMRRNAAAIGRAGGLAVINHPNFLSPIGSGALASVPGATLFELFNGNLQTNSRSASGTVGIEDQWDAILSSGRQMYGVATDDAHMFHAAARRDESGPGRGWVYVHARHLTAGAILDALARGDFYASTGVELLDYQITELGISVEVNAQASHLYRVVFIGLDGRVLQSVDSSCAYYAFDGTERYVRVRVEDSDGTVAWTQPYRPADFYLY